MAYVSKELKAKISPNIKAILKKYNVKGSLAVRNYSTLVLTIKSGNIDFINNFNDTATKRDPSGVKQIRKADGHIQVNEYWYKEHFSGKAVEFFEEIIAAMKGDDWFDDSDSQVDYFHTSHFININVGKWDTQYVVA